MIKLIPLIIFPLSFFLIFLGVKNLTGNFPLDKDNIDQNDKAEITSSNQDIEEIELKTATNKESKPINVDKNIINTEEIEKKPVNAEKKNIEKKLSAKTEKIPSSSNVSKKATNNISVTKEKKDIYLIQFGAFSKKKNAEDLKNSVMEKISTKFPGFIINLDFDEQKKLYKLISQTNDIGNAKKVCDFLKKIKISCLFKKQ